MGGGVPGGAVGVGQGMDGQRDEMSCDVEMLPGPPRETEKNDIKACEREQLTMIRKRRWKRLRTPMVVE